MNRLSRLLYVCVVFVTAILVVEQRSYAQIRKEADTTFHIKIDEWPLGTSMGNTWSVDQDSIRVFLLGNDLFSEADVYKRKFSQEEKKKIIELVNKIDIKTVKKNVRYCLHDNVSDDMPEFDFTITKYNATKRVHIYQVKIASLLNLTEYINTIIPPKYYVHYNNFYFGYLDEK